MRWPLILLCICLMFGSAAEAAQGRVIKVLPQFLDLKGRHTLSPSLFDRDAYQAQLRRHPGQRSGLRFAIQWKARPAVRGGYKLKVEIRGTAHGDLPPEKTLELSVTPRRYFSQWTALKIEEEDYSKFGDVTAWRATLWDGNVLVSEQKSFLW